MADELQSVGTISRWKVNGKIYDLKDKNLTSTLAGYDTKAEVDAKISSALENFDDAVSSEMISQVQSDIAAVSGRVDALDAFEHEFVDDEANANDNAKLYFVYDNESNEDIELATKAYVDNLIAQLNARIDEL